MTRGNVRAIALALALAVADLVLPHRGWGIPLFLLAVVLLVSTELAVRAHQPRHALPVRLFGYTAVLGAIAVGIYTAAGRTGLNMPGASNVIVLLSLVVWMTSAALFVRARSSVLDRYLLLDLGVFLIATLVVIKRLVLDPVFAAHPPEGLSPDLSMTMLLLEMAASVFIVRWITLPGPRPIAMWLLLSSLLASGTGSILANTLEPQLGMHLSLLCSSILAMVGVAHPSVRLLTEPSPPREEESFGVLRAMGIGAALLASPVTAWVVHERTDTLDAWSFFVPTTLVTGLVLLRLRLAFGRERAARAQLAARRQTFESLIHGISDVVVLLGEDARIKYVSASSSTALGRDADSLLGRSLTEIVIPEDAPTAIAVAAGVWGSRGTANVQVRVIVGRTVRTFETTFTDRVDNPSVGGVIAIFHDVTERNILEARLRHQALHDSLTSLPNRALLAERLVGALEHGDEVGMLFVDLDDFKGVNDGLGHEAGDRLLVAVADRLRIAVRGGDTIARLGGDEFAVLIQGGHAEEIARRILESLSEPFDIAGRRVHISASVGVASAFGCSPEDLLRNADVAMYRAKTGGKGAMAVFEQEMADAAGERLLLQMELGDAVEAGQFRLVYQPIFELESGRMTGVEALLRWEHPTRGLLAPDRFMTVAEESGLIIGIGRWVLLEACHQAAAWPGELHIAVNLSARQLEFDGIVNHVTAALDASGLDPHRLVLEITETMLARDLDATEAHLRRLTALGVRVAVDDFGTGYSSLSTLSRFPVHVLKIDRSFVATMLANTEASALVHVLVEMGRALHLEVVAEGIEELDQADALREQHCHLGQGFFFARPLEADALTDLLMETPVP